MSLFPMASLAAVRAALRYGLAGLGVTLVSTVQLQLLLAERLQRDRITQLGPEVLFQVRLGELALDRLPPGVLARRSGLPLRVGAEPPTRADPGLAAPAADGGGICHAPVGFGPRHHRLGWPPAAGLRLRAGELATGPDRL